MFRVSLALLLGSQVRCK